MAQPITFSDDIAFDNILVLQAHEGELLTVPGESWLLKADFKPQGHDLLLTSSDGSQVLIKDYFNLNNPPDLVTDSGGLIPAELAVQLAGPSSPGQFALLETGPFAQLAQASESIGRVEAIDGLVEAIRVDGTTITLAEGDDIFQGDTVVTGKGAAIGITFVDDTIFSLGEDGRMVIDEMVYDPASQEGTFNANLVQGVFTFVSGEIAKTGVDAMTVTTPVATIGIRGTKVAGRAAQEGADNTISLLPETLPDGTQVVGQLAVSNQSGGPPVVLSSPGATMQVKSAFSTLPPPVVFSPEQIQQNFGSTLTMQASTEVAKATNDASKNAAEAEEAKAEADQAAKEAEEAEAIAETAEEEAKVAEAEAEAAATEAEVAAIEAEALAAEAEAVGDAELIAEAEAKSAEAEALAVEAAAKAEEAEAQIAEAEAQIAEAEAQEAKAIAAKAEAEAKAVEAAETDAIAIRASQNLQIQNEAFAQFGGPVPPGTEDDSPPDGEVPPDGEAPPDGGPQGEGGPRPTEGEPPAGEGRLDETGEAPAEGPLDEEAAALAEATAIEEGAVGPEGDIPQDIALTPEGATDQFDGDLGGQPPPIDGTFGDQEGSFAGENPEGDIDAFGGEITPLGEDGPPAGDIAAFGADGPGLNDDAPGFGGDAPGFGGDAPGFGGDAPGFGGDAPGFGGDAPGFGGDAPGLAVTHQGLAVTHPGLAVTHQGLAVTHQGLAVTHQGLAVTHQGLAEIVLLLLVEEHSVHSAVAVFLEVVAICMAVKVICLAVVVICMAAAVMHLAAELSCMAAVAMTYLAAVVTYLAAAATYLAVAVIHLAREVTFLEVEMESLLLSTHLQDNDLTKLSNTITITTSIIPQKKFQPP